VISCVPQVLIRCDAGERHGLGHLIRSLTLAMALRQKGFEPSFVCHDPGGIAGERIKAGEFNVIQSPGHAGTSEDIAVIKDALGEDSGVIIFDSWDATESSLEPLMDKNLWFQ